MNNVADKKCACMLNEDELDCIIGGEDELVEEANKGLRAGTQHFLYAVMVEPNIEDAGPTGILPDPEYHHDEYHSSASIFRIASDAVKKIKALEISHPNRKYFLVAVGSHWREVPIEYRMAHY